jgi:hypothetical protein
MEENGMSRNLAGIIITVVVISILAARAMAADDPFIGTWKLNAAKSKSTQMPKSETIKCEALDNGLEIIDGIDPEGKAYHIEVPSILDGKDSPIKGFPYLDMHSAKKIDANTILHVAKKAGKELENWQLTVSKDGKTLTWTGKAMSEKGQLYSGTFIYDKQ